jgi:hypothetical protein
LVRIGMAFQPPAVVPGNPLSVRSTNQAPVR